MKIPNFKIVQISNNEPRCINCDARDWCGAIFKCECNYQQHYVDIKEERKLKLKKINNVSKNL